MKHNRLFIPNADSALPEFLQKTSDDADSSQTWSEIASVHGAVNYGETNAFRPLIRPKAQNGFVYRGDDDLTMEEAMKKGLAPKGMRPAWSPEARKRYEACIEPDIKKYKKEVDKINRRSEEDLKQHKWDFYSTALLGGLPGLFSAAKSDVPIEFKVRTETPPKRFLGNANRVIFWGTFSWATYGFVTVRATALRREAEDFTQATESFFEKVSECRAKNPYNMWVQLPPGESQIKEFLDSIKRSPTRRDYLNL